MKKTYRVNFEIEAYADWEEIYSGNCVWLPYKGDHVIVPADAEITDITPTVDCPNSSLVYSTYRGKRQYVAWLKRDGIWYDVSTSGMTKRPDVTDLSFFKHSHYEIVDVHGNILKEAS